MDFSSTLYPDSTLLQPCSLGIEMGRNKWRSCSRSPWESTLSQANNLRCLKNAKKRIDSICTSCSASIELMFLLREEMYFFQSLVILVTRLSATYNVYWVLPKHCNSGQWRLSMVTLTGFRQPPPKYDTSSKRNYMTREWPGRCIDYVFLFSPWKVHKHFCFWNLSSAPSNA